MFKIVLYIIYILISINIICILWTCPWCNQFLRHRIFNSEDLKTIWIFHIIALKESINNEIVGKLKRSAKKIFSVLLSYIETIYLVFSFCIFSENTASVFTVYIFFIKGLNILINITKHYKSSEIKAFI